MIIWILLISVAYLIYKWGTSSFDYFEKKGVKFNKPHFIVGSRLGMVLKQGTMADFAMKIYNEFANEKVTGMFEFRHPSFIIRDPELIKKMAIKDFDSFTDRRVILDENVEPIFAKTVFGMTGQKWKDMRATLSPTFTGSKMRLMFKLINQLGIRMTNSLKTKITKEGNNKFEFKELARKLTVDIIGSTAFGLEVNSIENPENDFMRIAEKSSDFQKPIVLFKFIGFFLFPKLMAFLRVKFFDEETNTFFTYAIKETFKTREKEGKSVRHDMIDLLIQARKGTLSHDESPEIQDQNEGFAVVEEHDVGKVKIKREWEDDEITAQCFIFFFAGFETISTVMTFMAYELVRDPEIQGKLQAEIDEVHESLNGGDLTYEHLHKMKYMDQVISETLRIHPPVPFVDRVCIKDYTLEYDGKSVDIEVGRNFFIPIYAIHHDEKYYPNPEKFDPERFSDENKHNINQDTYMPFGVGPRNCIGNRFALMEIKVLIYHLLLNFNFKVTEKTQIPFKLVNSQAIFQIENGLHLALDPRRK